MTNEDRGKVDDSLWLLVISLIFIVGIPALIWHFNHTWICYWGLYFSWGQLALIDWPFLPWAGKFRADVALMASRSDQVEFFELIWVMTKASIVCGWLPVLISVLTIRSTLRHRSEKVRRNITADTLPRIMSVHCPAIIPVLHYGNLLNDNVEGQESREHPAEFVKKHNLIRQNVLDEEKTKKILCKTLGPKITSLSQLKIYEKVLFAIFASRVFDSYENGGKAQQMLDALNRSCDYGEWNNKPGYPDFSVVRKEISQYMQEPEAQLLLNYFQYPSTFLMMLHLRALEGGKLPSSNFRWLKGIDRGLWYVLNATGRKGTCIESIIQIQTYRTEKLAWENGCRLIDPPLQQCVDALKINLIKEGLLPKPEQENNTEADNE
ncbi:hypothetical protein VET36_004530 [Salmonella enterica]|nr:hypothetical protein [Salmonella enterica]EMB2079738.1 hypothetical protein [Salmonella enterica]EMC4876270.1 hypothetical protein [Salmonella enterica]